MKNLLLATSVVLLMGVNAMAQQTQAVESAVGALTGGATATTRAGTTVVNPGTVSGGRAGRTTGRTASDSDLRSTTTGVANNLRNDAANATGVSARKTRTGDATIPGLRAPIAAAPAAVTCNPAVMAKTPLTVQAELQKGGFVRNCNEEISPAGLLVAAKGMAATRSVSGANAKLQAFADQIAVARGISGKQARPDAAKVICTTPTHAACFQITDKSVCDLAAAEGLLN